MGYVEAEERPLYWSLLYLRYVSPRGPHYRGEPSWLVLDLALPRGTWQVALPLSLRELLWRGVKARKLPY